LFRLNDIWCRFRIMKLTQKGRRKPRPFSNIPSHADFRGDGLLAPRPNPKLQDRPLSANRDCLLHVPAVSAGVSSTSDLRTW
jgi:hypothetical protein